MTNVVLAVVAALATQGDGVKLSVSTALQQGGFEVFMAHYKRDYAHGSSEYSQRHALFQERVKHMEEHNSDEKRLWTAGISHLTDRTESELSALYGWRGHGSRRPASLLSTDVSKHEEREAAASIDWNNLTMAENKRDQGGCGSCWAVATAVMLETRHEAQLGQTRGFSPQELVNCVPNPKECGGQGGCAGATVELAMKYAEESGLGDEDKTPYRAVDEDCPSTQTASSFLSMRTREVSSTKLSLDSWHTLPPNKAKPLMVSLLDGPVAISLGADKWSGYSHGVFNGCSKDAIINHAVVLMGYGEDGASNYWNVRNSWGDDWGEHGHIRLLRHQTTAEDDAHCGWDHKPEDGIACKPYPEKQYVCGMCGMLFDSVAVKFQKQ